jgi:isoleucyl-tRNA synthetase
VFRPVSADIDFVALERDELARWKEHRVFHRSMEQRRGSPPWIFYEGPPTANGQPGFHHVWARVYKDLFCRYQTMRGHFVDRRAGWDTHGLPVEVEVEKRLGISGKQAIEHEVGIAEFARLCRESVLVYVGEFERLTERIGYWVDTDRAYVTFAPEYVDSVWWQLKQIFDAGLLYEDLKVIPYCTRCETSLSSHELGQPGVYGDELDDAAYVRLALVGASGRGDLAGATHLAVWTTTPWTLLSNVAVAVNPRIDYVVSGGLVVAADLREAVLGEGATVEATIPGSALVGLRYERPFADVELPTGDGLGVVVGADYVTTEEGTGLVHQAPAFGEVDRQVARENGLPTVNPVGPDGTFTEQVPWLAGVNVRAANPAINDELERRGLLLRRDPYTHQLPHCWRCSTVLIYWGKPSWYIATSQRKDDMLRENATIDWHPSTIRDGRFGEWLENNVDWALSRDRYWGTPLPVWRCASGHITCVGSRAELGSLASRNLDGLDPHRPAIDEIYFDCPSCGEECRRVEPVIDAWFDSGAMPAAQVGYPHVDGSVEAFEYPAQFIAEAIDQTRGWFYTMLAVNTIVFGRKPYEHVLCLGHIVDTDGRKMSKSVGNVIDPWSILDTRGADAMRWWMFAQGSPWTPTRASLEAIDLTTRETLVTLWNTMYFFTKYASLNEFDPADPEVPAPSERSEMDRWILSRLESAASTVTASLDGYEPFEATKPLRSLVDELSNWYVRRCRRRFWRTDSDAPRSDSLAAQATLLEVLQRVAVMLAPFCPLVTDYMHRELHGTSEGDSVHFADWPSVDTSLIDGELEASMETARRLSTLGRAARAEAGVKVRQPLRRAVVYLAESTPRPPAGVVEDELNVDEIDYSSSMSDVLTFELVPNFKVLGPRLGESVKDLRAALAALDAAAAATELDSGGTVRVVVGAESVDLGPDELELRVRAQSGFAVGRNGSEVVALDLALDEALVRRGLARDLVRQIQDLRKMIGLDVSDRISLHLTGVEDLAEHLDEVAREVLAVKLSIEPGEGEGHVLEFDDGRDARAWIERA